MITEMMKHPLGFTKRVFIKKIIQPLKYSRKDDYDSESYWRDRFSKYGTKFQGAGHDGITEAENIKMYLDAENIFKEVLERLNFKKIKVLEIGPGSGFYTRILKSLGVKDYTAVDITDALFPVLKNKFPDYHFIKQDITKISFQEKYDLIIMIDVIQHIVNEAKFNNAMANIKEALNKDGIFILSPITQKSKKHLFYIRWRNLTDIKKRFPYYPIPQIVKFRGDYLAVIKASS